MYKRPIAGILGSVALLASFWPLVAAFEIAKDVSNSDTSTWDDLAGALIMASIAFGAILIGIRFLRFALNGQTEEGNGWLKPVLLGIGFFFPGFVFSLPLTIFVAIRIWPHDDGRQLGLAFGTSSFIGVLAALARAVLLLKKRKTKLKPK